MDRALGVAGGCAAADLLPGTGQLLALLAGQSVLVVSPQLRLVDRLSAGQRVSTARWGPDAALLAGTDGGAILLFEPVSTARARWVLVRTLRQPGATGVAGWLGRRGVVAVGACATVWLRELDWAIEPVEAPPVGPPVIAVLGCPAGRHFATRSEHCPLVKLWHPLDAPTRLAVALLRHPRGVAGMSWRPGHHWQTSVLLTLCRDGVARLWRGTGSGWATCYSVVCSLELEVIRPDGAGPSRWAARTAGGVRAPGDWEPSLRSAGGHGALHALSVPCVQASNQRNVIAAVGVPCGTACHDSVDWLVASAPNGVVSLYRIAGP